MNERCKQKSNLKRKQSELIFIKEKSLIQSELSRPNMLLSTSFSNLKNFLLQDPMRFVDYEEGMQEEL